MPAETSTFATSAARSRSLHVLGVVCGLTAGVWLAAAEAPTKFVMAGISPFVISLGMVCGVFVARWTLPTILKGTAYVFRDLRESSHLIVWAFLAGAMWSVANTLSIFAIRDVGLEIAFPLWNTASLVGLFWGCLFFRELRGAGLTVWMKVLGGGIAIVAGALLLSLATSRGTSAEAARAARGIAAALGAAALWGTMFSTYRKAYISGMNPLSFVTIFTFGELITMALLAFTFDGGLRPVLRNIHDGKQALFWLFLGGFFWVIGDLFAQYGAKYIGIGRTVPLMCTNQLWGLAWGALVFGELAGQVFVSRALVIVGSGVMALGALAVSTAVAPNSEYFSRREATRRECDRYSLDLERIEAGLTGNDLLAAEVTGRKWWDGLIVALAVGIFILLLTMTSVPPFSFHMGWTVVLTIIMLASLFGCGYLLWKQTHFS